MSGPRRQRARRAFAITTALLWLLGVEVLPNLHLAVHGDDHTHRADGTIVHRAAHAGGPGAHAGDHARHGHGHAHAHGHAADHHAHGHADGHGHAHAGTTPRRHPRPYPSLRDASPAPAKHHRPSRLAIDTPHDGHAAAGLAHHAIALHAPSPPLLAPVGAPAVARWRYPEPHARPRATATVRPTARGPPAA